VLVAIDLQEKLLPAIPAATAVVAGTRLLLRVARELDVPLLLTTQYRRGLGDVVPEVRELATEAPLDKLAFGCFGDEGFRARLRDLGRDQIVVTGVETHICVAQTVLGALDDGYAVHVASDAVGARRLADHGVGLGRMERAGALLSSVEMAVYELLGRSDGEVFRRLLPYLKGTLPP
jgi:nicotinamidase-related amidase